MVRRSCVVMVTVAMEPVVNGDVMHDRLLTRRDVSHHQQHHHHDDERGQQATAGRSSGIESLSDVLLTRVLYSGLHSDDLCRCAAVCRRWNRLVWNPLLWTCIDLSHAPDCHADQALRSVCLLRSLVVARWRLSSRLYTSHTSLFTTRHSHTHLIASHFSSGQGSATYFDLIGCNRGKLHRFTAQAPDSRGHMR